MTTKEAAKKLNMPEQSLRLFIKSGAFQSFAAFRQIGKRGCYYINERLLEMYLQGSNGNYSGNKKMPDATDIFHE